MCFTLFYTCYHVRCFSHRPNKWLKSNWAELLQQYRNTIWCYYIHGWLDMYYIKERNNSDRSTKCSVCFAFIKASPFLMYLCVPLRVWNCFRSLKISFAFKGFWALTMVVMTPCSLGWSGWMFLTKSIVPDRMPSMAGMRVKVTEPDSLSATACW